MAPTSRPLSLDTGVLFWPRGGSAQVIRYLLRELNSRGWTTTLHAGSLGKPGDPSHGSTFYKDLTLHPYDYNDAQHRFLTGRNPQGGPRPFHPSYEDRGHCPDPLFPAVPPNDADRITRAWTDHLTRHRSPDTGMLHLHHLSPLQTGARSAYPSVPRVTTLHGTELKLIDGMTRRLRLVRSAGTFPQDLARTLHTDNPHRTGEAHRLACTARLDDTDTELLTTTDWQKWAHCEYWLTRMRQAAHHAGDLAVVSDQDQELAQRLLHLDTPPPVIPNGVDTTAFQPHGLTPDERMRHLRHWLVADPQGWAPGQAPGSIRYTDRDLKRLLDRHGRPRPLLLWVGRYLDFKRVPILLQAFAALRTRLDPAPALLMWGGYPGEYEGVHPADIAAHRGIQKDVFFAGWRGHDELPTGLNCADLLVAPAVNEPFGMVYLEAMACGTPPVATATGGPLRTITPTGPTATGWLVKPDDTNDLADTLTTALADPAELARRGANGRTRTLTTYSWSHTADRYLDLYNHARTHA
ncbi:glycosyltransferase family 4 protein [Streptomyces sp. NBC_01237]|uniref:glycosyltransferase family 4 protein n=1 Tax=Streptomyces sp. NBC_01237 TaxID=2903790 RepID=UPI002DDBBF5B|nr:glycosyltransferase family 4 protein [Streptomyces sp. NBC_01237]WRZ77230.1 glycosyltransferase family 4 protein [Streptomyces sp. NBC_01237]